MLTGKSVDPQWSRHSPSSESNYSSRNQNRRKSTSEASRSNRHQDRHRDRDDRSRDGRNRDKYRDQDSDDSSHDDSSQDDSSRDESSRDKGHSSFLKDKGGQILMHAALPLLAAGAAEALRARKQPGEWKGDKGKQVLSAAVSNGLIHRDPGKATHNHIMDTTFQGLREGGPSREERHALQRKAAASRTSNNLKKVAVAGAVAFAGKELYDRYGRSKSQKREDVHDYYDDNYRSKKRSQSVSGDSHRGDREGSDYSRRSRGRDRDSRSNRLEAYAY